MWDKWVSGTYNERKEYILMSMDEYLGICCEEVCNRIGRGNEVKNNFKKRLSVEEFSSVQIDS
ncbi:hypothetical protein F441_19496 [Phytophthora nicotianae CJ01A1]|uniref:Uncharacterized protein n=2 Tax=Phytophthora nicotianae TaxID=4792 RepID=W2W1R8_PHYNI|nr:hypothetical protein F444_19625 [Phytophthora nicotianae P1976]ETP03554.1 hypothetical protein F441_19496 [Phytophthora nicotianae CJ01A1]